MKKIKDKKTQKKKLIAAKSGLVGMKRYLKTHTCVKNFLSYLAVFDWDRFLRQTLGAVFES